MTKEQMDRTDAYGTSERNPIPPIDAMLPDRHPTAAASAAPAAAAAAAAAERAAARAAAFPDPMPRSSYDAPAASAADAPPVEGGGDDDPYGGMGKDLFLELSRLMGGRTAGTAPPGPGSDRGRGPGAGEEEEEEEPWPSLEGVPWPAPEREAAEGEGRRVRPRGGAESPPPTEKKAAAAVAAVGDRIRRPHPHDVLCGRGRGFNHHPGNVAFRALVASRKEKYCLASSRSAKNDIVRDVMGSVQSLDPPGRFLLRDEGNPLDEGKDLLASDGRWLGCWVEADDAKAHAKTSQALREGATELRRRGKRPRDEDTAPASPSAPSREGGDEQQPERRAAAARSAEMVVEIDEMTPEQLCSQARRAVRETEKSARAAGAAGSSHNLQVPSPPFAPSVPSSEAWPQDMNIPSQIPEYSEPPWPISPRFCSQPPPPPPASIQLMQQQELLDQQLGFLRQQQALLRRQQSFTKRQYEEVCAQEQTFLSEDGGNPPPVGATLMSSWPSTVTERERPEGRDGGGGPPSRAGYEPLGDDRSCLGDLDALLRSEGWAGLEGSSECDGRRAPSGDLSSEPGEDDDLMDMVQQAFSSPDCDSGQWGAASSSPVPLLPERQHGLRLQCQGL